MKTSWIIAAADAVHSQLCSVVVAVVFLFFSFLFFFFHFNGGDLPWKWIDNDSILFDIPTCWFFIVFFFDRDHQLMFLVPSFLPALN